MAWVLIRYTFDEDHRCWQPDGYTVFHTDEALLNFLRAQAPMAYKYRYEITTTKERGGGE